MSITVKERNEIPEQYKWDLKPMYASDEAWEADFQKFSEVPEKLSACAGTFAESAEKLRAYFDLERDAIMLLENIYGYAALRKTEDGRCERAVGMMSRAMSKYAEFSAAVSFARPEILALPDETLASYMESPLLQPYHYGLECLIREKAHTLSKAEEKIMASFSEVLSAPGEVQDALQDVDMLFSDALDSEGKAHKVTGAAYIDLQMSPDRVLRENAFKSFYKTYREHINTLGMNYAASVKGDCISAKLRNYESARAMSMASEQVPTFVYDGLIESVHNHMDAMYSYVALRKKILGVPEIHYYDVYAPLAKDVDISYSIPEAQEMVLSAVSVLGENYVNVVKQAFRDRWVDYYPNVGKGGGAYSSGTYTSAPYIMMNYTGSVDSVSTLAHEMGHSLHTWHSNHTQEPQNANYTLFVAEVASTVNENLLIEQLLQKDVSKEMRLYLLNQYLENFKGTIFRQTMFAEFEKIVHEMYERGEALTPEALSKVYEDLVRLYFGPEMVIDPEVRYEWSRIPHFFNAFYVYKYATSYSASVALSEGILRDGQPAVDKYLKFLSLGGSMDPLDELKVAGVDMSVSDPIDRALEKFGRIVKEAEACYEAIMNEK